MIGLRNEMNTALGSVMKTTTQYSKEATIAAKLKAIREV
jgi:hypothetical protein